MAYNNSLEKYDQNSNRHCEYMEQALDFAREGMTTLNEAIRVGLARRCEL